MAPTLSDISKLYIGNQEISKVYYGETKIWPEDIISDIELIQNGQFADTSFWTAPSGFQTFSTSSGSLPAIAGGELRFAPSASPNVVSQIAQIPIDTISTKNTFTGKINIRHQQNAGTGYSSIDVFYFLLEFRNSSNAILTTKRIPASGTTQAPQNFTEYTLTLTREELPTQFDNITNVRFVIHGLDTGFWAGNYGPRVNLASLILS